MAYVCTRNPGASRLSVKLGEELESRNLRPWGKDGEKAVEREKDIAGCIRGEGEGYPKTAVA